MNRIIKWAIVHKVTKKLVFETWSLMVAKNIKNPKYIAIPIYEEGKENEEDSKI